MNKTKLLVRPQRQPLRGSVTVPGDKSISHRAVILAAIADGRSCIRDWLPAGDTIATLEAIQAMGIPVSAERHSAQAWDLIVEGRGRHGLQQPAHALDCRNAGTCMRLLTGVLAGQRFSSLLDGSEQLRKRPMRRITDPLQQMGARITARDGRAPLAIEPAKLQGITYPMKVASAQVKSAILLAGLYADGATEVHQPGPARDHTERMLQAMDASITTDGKVIRLRGDQPLSPLELTVPGDISSAAFLLVAAAIVPHSQIAASNVGHNETRTGILDMMSAMGAHVDISNQRITGGEPSADMTFQFEELHNTAVAGDTVVRAIDEFPIWAVATTQAAGESSVRDAAELRVKEIDRISALAEQLRIMGAEILEHPDGLTIHGPGRLHGSEVDSRGDHRLGMALVIAALAADSPTLVHNAECIADSFPGFVETLQTLGADVIWVA